MIRGHGERCKAAELLLSTVFPIIRLPWALGLRVHLIFLPVTSRCGLCPKSCAASPLSGPTALKLYDINRASAFWRFAPH